MRGLKVSNVFILFFECIFLKFENCVEIGNVDGFTDKDGSGFHFDLSWSHF